MRICEFYFSATGNTQKIVRKIAEGLKDFFSDSEIVDYNFSRPSQRTKPPTFDKDDIVIAGVPTYAGRVPNLLLKFLREVKAEGAKGILITTYGNRSPDDSLMELSILMKEAGMKIISGGTFVGQHSFSDILAKGRPDERDFLLARELGVRSAKKIISNDFSAPILPGENPIRPYFTPRDRNGVGIDFISIKPKTNAKLCNDCKICAKLCPLGSIEYENPTNTPMKCMKCNACVKYCPENAKYFSDNGYEYHKKELEELYFSEKKSEIFI